jgi:hypothetical protein
MTQLIREGSGVLRRMTGEVTMEQLDESATRLQGDGRIDALRYIIHDFSLATDVIGLSGRRRVHGRARLRGAAEEPLRPDCIGRYPSRRSRAGHG